MNTTILIIGAGPTGLTLACELQKRKIDFIIIDKKNAPSTTTKAIGIQPRTMELFAYMDIIDDVIEEAVVVQKTNLFINYQKTIQYNYEHVKNTPYPFLLSLPQCTTEAILLKQLHKLGGKVTYNTEFINLKQHPSFINAELKKSDNTTTTISCQYLISCEGARSKIRKQLNIPFSGNTYKELFLFADVEINWKLSRQEMYGWFHKNGLLAVAPLPNTKQWKIFVDISSKELQKGEENIDFIEKVMHNRTNDPSISLSNPTWLRSFIVNHRIVNHYQRGNIFLVGDAAHIHSPLGGQGMNMGIQDAYNLAWKLALVVQNKVNPTLLLTYEKERLPVAKDILRRTHINTKVLTAKNGLIRFMRNQIAIKILALPFVQKYWLTRSSQLAIHYANSLISHNHFSNSLYHFSPFLRNCRAGKRVPDFEFSESNNKKANLYTLIKNNDFILLIFPNKEKIFRSFQTIHQQLPTFIKTYGIISSNSSLKHSLPFPLLMTNQQIVSNLFNIKNDGLCLIRPDGYIAYYSSEINIENFNNYLYKKLGTIQHAK